MTDGKREPGTGNREDAVLESPWGDLPMPEVEGEPDILWGSPPDNDVGAEPPADHHHSTAPAGETTAPSPIGRRRSRSG